jgi:thiol:disulfide interchange protein DsbA
MAMVFVAVFGTMGAACSRAAELKTAELKEGQDYSIVESTSRAAGSVDKSAKISVTEFFSYQCPHCFAFSKPLREWSSKLPVDVQFERESVSIGHESWVPIARTYYALRSSGKLDSLDEKIFSAIHEQGVRLDDIAYIMGWLNKNNVSPTEFDATYRSQPVRDAFGHGEKLAIDYKIPSIPVMLIDGKYMVMIKSNVDFGQQLGIVDQLIARVRQARASQK